MSENDRIATLWDFLHQSETDNTTRMTLKTCLLPLFHTQTSLPSHVPTVDAIVSLTLCLLKITVLFTDFDHPLNGQIYNVNLFLLMEYYDCH